MTKITFTEATGGHAVGDTLDTSAGAAKILIEAGAAEAHDTKGRGKGKTSAKDTQSDDVGGTSPSESDSTAG